MVLEMYYNKKKDFKSALDTALQMEALGNQSHNVPVYYWLLGEKQLAQNRFKTLISKIPLEFVGAMREKNKEIRKKWGITEEMEIAFDELLENYKASLNEEEGATVQN